MNNVRQISIDELPPVPSAVESSQSFYNAFAQACDEAFAEGKEEIECAPTLRSPG